MLFLPFFGGAPKARAQVASSSGEGPPALASAPPSIRPHAGGGWVDAHAIVRLHAGASAADLPVDEARVLSATWGLVRVRAHGLDGEALAARLGAHPAVLDASPDLLFERRRSQFAVPPNDPRYGGQWYLDRLALEDAWRVEQGSEDVGIVIVDNGCEMDHPDLAGRFVGGIDVVGGDDDPTFVPGEAGNEHGTACAG
ncbi:MAG: hypothetical protein AAGH15_10865, partial [Myxococcota bacterium]